MSISNVLFNPNGRITPNEFWRGIIMLVGAQIIISLVTGFAPVGLAIGVLFATILLVYPYICVYGKRLHDSGRSAWMFLAFFCGWLLLIFFVMPVLFEPFIGQQTAELQEDMEIVAQDGDVAAMFEILQQQARIQFIPGTIQTVLVNAIVGFFVARLPSDPDTNQYGPPTMHTGNTFS